MQLKISNWSGFVAIAKWMCEALLSDGSDLVAEEMRFWTGMELSIPYTPRKNLSCFHVSVQQNFLKFNIEKVKAISILDVQLFLFPFPVWRYLEPGAYPVVSPDGGRFPEFMTTPRHAHNLTFRPENGRHTLLVTSPVPGEWYMLAYTNRQQKKDFVQQVCLFVCFSGSKVS